MAIAIIIAGGVGSRRGHDIPKQFFEVDGKKVLTYTLENFQSHQIEAAIEVSDIDGWNTILF